MAHCWHSLWGWQPPPAGGQFAPVFRQLKLTFATPAEIAALFDRVQKTLSAKYPGEKALANIAASWKGATLACAATSWTRVRSSAGAPAAITVRLPSRQEPANHCFPVLLRIIRPAQYQKKFLAIADCGMSRETNIMTIDGPRNPIARLFDVQTVSCPPGSRTIAITSRCLHIPPTPRSLPCCAYSLARRCCSFCVASLAPTPKLLNPPKPKKTLISPSRVNISVRAPGPEAKM